MNKNMSVNGDTPILVSVIKDQDWNPFDEGQREYFEDRRMREEKHTTWLSDVHTKIRNAELAQMKKVPAQREGNK